MAAPHDVNDFTPPHFFPRPIAGESHQKNVHSFESRVF
jgi:hypothetical protein